MYRAVTRLLAFSLAPIAALRMRFPAENLAGLGVEQSMRGRIRDLGGTTTINGRPGEGTEVEFWISRRP
jgi:signal transduction histidine kinase